MLEVRGKATNIRVGLSGICCGLACLVLGCASGTSSITRLLPSEFVAKGWTPQGTPRLYGGASLYDFINGGAEIFFEYGFRNVVYQGYEMNDSFMGVEIYEVQEKDADSCA